MTVFNYRDYKHFVRATIEALPRNGRGEYRRIAQHLRVSSTMVSQIFGGDKHLNLELASDVCDHFALNEFETEYFFLLVEHARAGTERLRKKLDKRITDAQTRARQISQRVAKHKELSEEEKARYYSSWIFTGLRNLAACEGPWTVLHFAQTLKVSEAQIREALGFLTSAGLLGPDYSVLSKATHLPADHPLVGKHHQNWRIRGIQKMEEGLDSSLFYTGPMSLSEEDASLVRQMLLDLVQKINALVVKSPSQTVRCLNLDWFRY